jgi:hypothetical protein
MRPAQWWTPATSPARQVGGVSEGCVAACEVRGGCAVAALAPLTRAAAAPPAPPQPAAPPAAPPLLAFEGGSFPLTQRELQAAVDLLLAMARVLPLQIVSLDVAALLTCHQPFLDVMRSDPPARGALLRGALELLRTLAARAGPGSGVVRTLAARLMGLVGQLVGEYEEAMRLRGSPQDFTQVGAGWWRPGKGGRQPGRQAGPLPPESPTSRARRRPQAIALGPLRLRGGGGGGGGGGGTSIAGAAAAADAALRGLETFQRTEHQLLIVLLSHLQAAAAALGRHAALLLAEPLPRLLDPRGPFDSQLRHNALVTLYAILTRAGPDVADDAAWLEPAADPGPLSPRGRGAAGTAPPGGTAAGIAAAAGLAALPLDVGARRAALARLEAAMRPLELQLERLHAAVFTLRAPLVTQLERAAQPGDVAPAPAGKPAQGIPAPGAGSGGGGAAGGGGGADVTFVGGGGQQQIATTLTMVLARAYALRLQAGAAGWRDVEARVLAPYPSLHLFWVHCSSTKHRGMAVFLAAQLPADAPSILHAPADAPGGGGGAGAGAGAPAAVAVQGRGPPAWRGPGAGGGSVPEAAAWLVKMWLRAAIDSSLGAPLSQLTWQLARLAPTSPLLARAGAALLAKPEPARLAAFKSDWAAGRAAAGLIAEAAGGGGGGGAGGEGALWAGKAGGLRGMLVDGALSAAAADPAWGPRLVEVGSAARVGGRPPPLRIAPLPPSLPQTCSMLSPCPWPHS